MIWNLLKGRGSESSFIMKKAMRVFLPVAAAALLLLAVGILGRSPPAPPGDPPLARPLPGRSRPLPRPLPLAEGLERDGTARPAPRAVSAGPPEGLVLLELATPEESVVINEIQYRPKGGDRRD